MSNKSGVSEQIISAPEGGGALSGIGEKFSPDLFTGSGNFTVPIALPPGRNGFQPEVNLVYSTGNGNGPFGLGWNLNIPGVTRQTAKGIPRYRDDADDLSQRDTFVLSGAEDLVPVEAASGWVRYRPRTEGLFARIIHHCADGNNYWQVESKDGLTSYYGTPRPDDAGAGWQDPAVVADPEPGKQGHIFAWKLTRTTDPFGNRILYTYRRATQPTNENPENQLYLSSIKYIDYTEESGAESYLAWVAFDYEERPDPFSACRAGFAIRTTLRCRQIRIETQPSPAARAAFYRLDTHDPALPERILIRTYDFTYRNDAPNGVSLLRQIQVTGHDESQSPVEKRTQALPPLEFGYTTFNAAGRDFFPLAGELPDCSLANPDLELADLFGNGLPDIVQMNGAVRYWRNRGDGSFDLPHTMTYAPAGLSLADPGVQLIDADGDARVDLLATLDGLAGYFPLRFGAEPSEVGWDQRSFQRYAVAPSFNLEDPEVRLVDLTGDGVTDVIRSGSRLECFFNDPKTGWGETRWMERRDIEVFPNISFSDPRVKWGDMSGDGLQDIVLIHDGNVEYWPNLGYGDWGPRIHMANSPRLPYGHDPQRILVGDVDGDGLADIVYVEDTQVTLWINQSGNGWSAPITIEGTPQVSDMDAVRLADMLGSGVGGVLWTRDATAYGRANYFFLDFTGGVKPYVLDAMDNHMGAITRVHYRPSTWYYRQDAEQPATRWRTPLPFPVQVVAQVEVIDAISQGKLTTEYRYHHGYWDGVEREFRGFGLVEQLDSESFAQYNAHGLHGAAITFKDVGKHHYSPPMLTKTWFHQGPVGEEYGAWELVDWKEADWSAMYWPGDPQLLDHTVGVNGFLQTMGDRSARRDALRALRGRILRSELYALDDDAVRTERPYTVTEYAYDLREEAPPTDTASERPRLFFPHTVAQRVTQWERGEDPMTQFSFTGAYDAYGQPQQQTALALPRRQAKRVAVTGAVVGALSGDEVNETCILATHTRTEYAASQPDRCIHNRVAQVTTYELDAPPTVVESEPGNLAQVMREQRDAALSIHAQFQRLDGVRLIGHTLNHYDGEAHTGLPVGELGQFGALSRSETLVFTDRDLDAAYGEHRPIYLGGTAALPDGAPAGFGEDSGYRRASVSPTGYHDGYYADTQRQRFDFQPEDGAPAGQTRGLVLGVEDALGHRAIIAPDVYWLLPVTVTDPVGLMTSAAYDYRVLQPRAVTDPNDNATHFCFTPLGLLNRQFLVGREGQGGTEERPEIRFEYNFLAWTQSDPQPVYVHTQRRIEHASESDSDEIIESREYSDGFGRLIQTRTQAEELVFGATGDDVGLPLEPGSATTPAIGHREPDRVVVSGWQVYDNKGQVVEKYEPFFDRGWDYQSEEDAKQGQHVTMFYDPRGQVIRTVNPDGSEQRVIYGVPGTIEAPNLGNPGRYEPTPWEACTYDANDNAERTHPGMAAAGGWRHHLDTPASILIDGLGRTILAVARNRNAAADAGNPPELYLTRSRYDVRGNLETVIDAHGRPAFQYAYDLRNNALRIQNIDAGLRTSVLDANGNLVEYRDSKGSVVLRRYDALNRLRELWARNNDTTDSRFTLRERLVYGDDDNREAARAINALGRLTSHYDEAGVIYFEQYDFKGNLGEKVRQVIGDRAIATGWLADWNAADAEDALDPTRYQTSTHYDALNRSTRLVYPEDVEGNRATQNPHYNRAGALDRIELDGEPYVTEIAYNAKGQRVLIAYGNRVMTRYVYEPHTFRLARMRSERCRDVEPADDTWVGQGERTNAFTLFQDLAYSYDLVGNITVIDDCAPCSGIRDSIDGRHRLRRYFAYDAIYRLTAATGRACKDIGTPRPLADLPRCGFVATPYAGGAPTTNVLNAPELTEAYTERYGFDPMGNMLELAYMAESGRWARRFGMDEQLHEDWAAATNNRMTSLAQSSETHTFTYDPNGNMLGQNTDRHYTWNHADRLVAFANQPEGVEHASVAARYLYGADGIRVNKWVRTNTTGGGESTVYVDGIFERYTDDDIGLTNNHLHVIDNQQRVALLRHGESPPDDTGPALQYYLSDHLMSTNVTITELGQWILHEEFTSYGETSFGGFFKNRYRFTGMERDDESGLNYHIARYYTPWSGRWIDPDRLLDISVNEYQYGSSNPMKFIDQLGLWDEPWEDEPPPDNCTPTSLQESSEDVEPGEFTVLEETLEQSIRTEQVVGQNERRRLIQQTPNQVPPAQPEPETEESTSPSNQTRDEIIVANRVLRGINSLSREARGPALSGLANRASLMLHIFLIESREYETSHAQSEIGRDAHVAVSELFRLGTSEIPYIAVADMVAQGEVGNFLDATAENLVLGFGGGGTSEALSQFESDARAGREGVLWEMRAYARDVNLRRLQGGDLFENVARTEQRWTSEGRPWMRPWGQVEAQVYFISDAIYNALP